MSSLVVQASAAFGAGLLSSLSPCVYPMIPISVGFFSALSGHHRRVAIILFLVGQVVTFTALGVVATKAGEVFGFSGELKWVNITTGVLMIGFGLSSLFSYIPSFLHKWNNVSQKLHTAEVHDYVLPLLIGVGSALLASPCTGPILGTVLLTLSQDSTFNQGLVLMLAYSIGVSVLFCALGFGILALESMPRAGRWMNTVHRVTGGLIIAFGVYYIARAF